MDPLLCRTKLNLIERKKNQISIRFSSSLLFLNVHLILWVNIQFLKSMVIL